MPTYNENLARLIDPSTSKVPFSKLATPLTQSDLTDLSVGSGTTGQTIKWNGSAWTHADVPSVDTASYATEAYINTKVTDLINGAPAALDTLAEFATALDNNSAIGTEIQTHIANGKMKAFVADGSTDEFQFNHQVGNVDVWLNGVKLNPQVASNSDQTYLDNYMNSHDDDRAFRSGSIQPGTVWTLLEHSEMNAPFKNGTLFYLDLAGFPDEASAESMFGSIYTTNPAEYGTIYFKTGATIAYPAEGGNGDLDGTYAYQNARVSWSGGFATINFEAQSGDDGNTGMDWWITNYDNHLNIYFEAAWFAPGNVPGPGGFGGMASLGSVATHIKTEVMPDSGDIVIVRSY